MPAPPTILPVRVLNEHGPEALLRMVADEGGIMQAVAKYNDGKRTAWTNTVAKAREMSGLDWRDFLPGGSHYLVSQPASIPEQSKPSTKADAVEAAIQDLASAAVSPSSARLATAPADVMQQVESEMQSHMAGTEEEELPRVRLPKTAKQEDIPSTCARLIWREQPTMLSPGASPEEIVEFYMKATTYEEAVHTVRLQVVPGKAYAALHPFSDIHAGSLACDFARWVAFVNWCHGRKGHYVIGVGDMTEASTLGSVRSASLGYQVLDEWNAIKALQHTLAPVSKTKQLIGLLEGNHDWAVWKATGQKICLVEWMADALGVPDFGYEVPIKFLVGDQEYVIYFHHGAGGGQTIGYFWNTLERLSRNNRCDAVVMGHRHVAAFQPSTYRGEEDGKWILKETAMIGAGTFRRSPPQDYARVKNMPPEKLGTVAIRLYGDRHDLHARL